MPLNQPPLTPIDYQMELVDRLAFIELGLERVMKCLLNRLITINNDCEKKFTVILDQVFNRIDQVIQNNTELLRIVLQSIQNSIISRLDYSENILTTINNRIETINNTVNTINTTIEVNNNDKKEEIHNKNGKGLVDNNNGQGKIPPIETIQPSKEDNKKPVEKPQTVITPLTNCPIHLTCNCNCPISESLEKIITTTTTSEKTSIINSLIERIIKEPNGEKIQDINVFLPTIIQLFNAILVNTNQFSNSFYGIVNGLIMASIENNFSPQAIYNGLLLSLKDDNLQSVITDKDEKCIKDMTKEVKQPSTELITQVSFDKITDENFVLLHDIFNPDARRILPVE